MTPKALLHPARLARRPVLSTQTDERLVDLVRAGYGPAFEAIVERYRRPLLGYVARIVPGGRAEDVVQHAFVNAYESMLRTDSEIRLRAWLYRIAHNTALNALRDRGLTHSPLDERIDGVERPDQAFERREGFAELLAAVQALPPRQRDAIVLRELEGRSYEEISAALGVGDGAVRQLLNRARTTLRAAATAVTPVGLVTRLPWADAASEPMTARVAELVGVGAVGGGAVAAKLCATALVSAAVVGGGIAMAPSGDSSSPLASTGGGAGEEREPARRAAVAAGAASRDSETSARPAPAEDRSGSGGREDDRESTRWTTTRARARPGRRPLRPRRRGRPAGARATTSPTSRTTPVPGAATMRSRRGRRARRPLERQRILGQLRESSGSDDELEVEIAGDDEPDSDSSGPGGD